MNFKQILGGQIDHIHCIFSFFINQNVHRVQNQETISKPHNPISRSTGFGRKQLQPANGTSKPMELVSQLLLSKPTLNVDT